VTDSGKDKQKILTYYKVNSLADFTQRDLDHFYKIVGVK